MLGVALLIVNILRTFQHRQISQLVLIILVVLSVLSFRQVRNWTDDETLFGYNLSVFPTSTVSHQVMADIYFMRRDYQKSLNELQRVLDVRPANSMIIVKAGVALENLGKLDEAEKLYKAALEKNILSTEILNNLGRINFIKGQMQPAEKFWIASVQASRTNFESQFNLGVLYLKQGKFRESLEAFLKAKNISPNNPLIDDKIQEVKRKIE